MTAPEVINRLWFEFKSGSMLLVPNYTPRDWFECDLFRVTKAGYGVEYEVKLSVRDFRDDARKADAAGRKHEQLAGFVASGPSRFWYVVPAGIADDVRDNLPAFAGLMTFGRNPRGLVIFQSAAEAPILHRERVPGKVLDHARSVFYWRYWQLRHRQQRAARNLEAI